MNRLELIEHLKTKNSDEQLHKLYPADETERQRIRYIDAINEFARLYPKRSELKIYSAPGRTEICGNHTDHQNGHILAASVDLDAIAVVAFHDEGVIRIKSEGYDPLTISLDDKCYDKTEKATTDSLVKGIVSCFIKKGVEVGGFDAYVTSEVRAGSGLSSSAAFEVLVGNVIDEHYAASSAGPVEIAQIGQFAENVYFGKKSGLMDQMVSSVGGLVCIDFAGPGSPVIKKIDADPESFGIITVITDTKGSHAGLSGDYTAIPTEMRTVAEAFGKDVLGEVDKNEFYRSIGKLRNICSDRAILRAAHFFDDDERVKKEADALEGGDMELFLKLVRESGISSALRLQNLYSMSNPMSQEIPLALMLSEKVFRDKGACRVHGGGFAGTIQAFVPAELLDEYQNTMEEIFGSGCCHILHIRNVGGCRVF